MMDSIDFSQVGPFDPNDPFDAHIEAVRSKTMKLILDVLKSDDRYNLSAAFAVTMAATTTAMVITKRPTKKQQRKELQKIFDAAFDYAWEHRQQVEATQH